MTDNTVNIGGPVPPRKIYQNPDAEAETLTIIGTAYKGPAFVPQQVVQQGNSNDIKNTFVGIFGDSEKNRYRSLKDEYDYHIDSQGFVASENWFQNGGDQVSYTRVLGIGTGIKDDDGLYIDSGFNVSNLISSGSIKRSGDNFYSNPYSVAGGHNGSLSFLIKRFKDKKVDENTIDGFKNYLSELGISANTKKLITDVIISPSGVVPTIHESSATNLPQDAFTKEINSSEEFNAIYRNLRSKVSLLNFSESTGLYGSYKGKTHPDRLSDRIYLYLNGLDNNNIHNVVEIPDDSNRFIKNNRSYNENKTKNYFSNRILEKGNLFYSTFQSLNSLSISASANDNDHNINLITTIKHSEISSNTNLPDYNDFTDRFRTAKTPWITSQPVNRTSLDSNREKIHENVLKLFRVHSIDDGEVGNRFRIKIHPKQIFSENESRYSIFSLYVYEYSATNNTYTILETYSNLDLNPDSEDFIGRRIGTQYQYYDIERKRIYTKGFYPLISDNIRIELHEKVNNKTINTNCIPSGFEAYPHISFNKLSFEHYDSIESNFYSSLGNIDQMPVIYTPSYINDDTDKDFKSYWGPLFFNVVERKKEVISKNFNKNGTSTFDEFSLIKNNYVKDERNNMFSPHFFYTKYFQSNNNNSNKNVLIEETNWNNSFFHLEKIIYPVIKDTNTNLIKNDFTEALYKRSGTAITSSYLPNDLHDYYSFLNIDDVLNEEKNDNYKVDSRFLTFDLFTYGGYDGTNILDYDKKSLNNNAIVRESFRENKSITKTSYEKCIELSTKYENCLGDILILPGIKEESLVKKCLKDIQEENRLIFCSDISGLTTTNEILGSYYKTVNEVGINRNSSLIKDIEEDSEGIRTNPYRELVKTNFSNFSLFDRTNFDSKSFVPLLGDVIDESRKIVLCPTIYTTGLMAKTISENINDIDLQYNIGSELLDDENFKSSNEKFIINEKRFKDNGLNIIFEDNSTLEGTPIKLMTYNTTFGIRSSVYRQASTARILNYIKKKIEFLLILGPNSVLFNSASQISNIYQNVKYSLDSLMTSIKDEGIISNYSVSIPQDDYASNNSDIVENLLSGKIYIQLSDTNNKDADFTTITLGELDKEIKSFTNLLDSIKILSVN